MSYRLQKPVTDKERADFIVAYNHNSGLRIEEGSDTYTENGYTFKGEFFFALEPNEMMDVVEAEIDVINYEGDIPSSHKELVELYKPVINPNYEQEQAQKEAERIARLHLTRGDVFRGLLQAKGVTRAQLRAIIEALPEENQEQSLAKEMALIDFDEALEFYRGVSLIETVGLQLGITSEQMTKFFETNDYHELI